MPYLSIALPAIRTHRWPALIESIKKGCKKYTWELVLAGPFLPPPEIRGDNIHFVKTYARPSVAFQLAVAECTGELYFGLAGDDAIVHENRIDEMIDYFN